MPRPQDRAATLSARPAGFSRQSGAFSRLQLTQRELPSGAEACGSSEPPAGDGVVPSAGEANRPRSPQAPFRHLLKEGRAIRQHKDLMLFIPNLPSSAW